MWPSPRGLAEKPILLKNGEFRAETTRCSKCDHLPHDGSVRLDFMTDDVNEAEEMRFQTVASGAWPKPRILMNPVGLECEANVGERVRWSTELGQYRGSLTDAAQQLICNQQIIGSNPIAGLECKADASRKVTDLIVADDLEDVQDTLPILCLALILAAVLRTFVSGGLIVWGDSKWFPSLPTTRPTPGGGEQNRGHSSAGIPGTQNGLEVFNRIVRLQRENCIFVYNGRPPARVSRHLIHREWFGLARGYAYRCRRTIAIAAIMPKGIRMKSAMRLPIAKPLASGPGRTEHASDFGGPGLACQP